MCWPRVEGAGGVEAQSAASVTKVRRIRIMVLVTDSDDIATTMATTMATTIAYI